MERMKLLYLELLWNIFVFRNHKEEGKRLINWVYPFQKNKTSEQYQSILTETKVADSREKIYNIYNKVLISGMYKSIWRKSVPKMAKKLWKLFTEEKYKYSINIWKVISGRSTIISEVQIFKIC